MKELLIPMTAMVAFSLSAPVSAGNDGDCHLHGNTPAKAETVLGCAVKCQQALIAGDKLDKSWQSIKPGTSEQVDGQRGKGRKVTFEDPVVADKSKANLYMFLTLQGNFIAVNFIGN